MCILVPSLNITEAKLQAAIAQVEEAGARVAAQRKSLKSLCRVLTRGDLAHPSTYRPLLVELVETLKVCFFIVKTFRKYLRLIQRSKSVLSVCFYS